MMPQSAQKEATDNWIYSKYYQ